MKKADFVNPFELPGQWYKANFHTHTTTSDSTKCLANTVRDYRKAGYDVLVISDHLKTNPIRKHSNKDMLVISGMELHPAIPGRDDLFHMVAINVPRSFKSAQGMDAQKAINAANKVGGAVILAHPFWCGVEYADFKHLKGLAGVEVWNTICDIAAGRGTSENEWAYMLDRGMTLPCVGVDDTHGGPTDIFGGWTWLKMKSPTTANVLKAIRSGACYASTGPVIKDFRVENGKLKLKCTPVRTINFKAGPGAGHRKNAPEGKTITSFTVNAPTGWPFVRAVVTDDKGKQAWTQPIFLK
jgi:hypothetical protein